MALRLVGAILQNWLEANLPTALPKDNEVAFDGYAVVTP